MVDLEAGLEHRVESGRAGVPWLRPAFAVMQVSGWTEANDRDYFSVPDDRLRQTSSVLTVVGGAIVHSTGKVD